MTKQEKCSKTQKNRIVIHKGDSEKRVYIDELNKYLAEGWVKGISEIHRQTNSKSHKNNTHRSSSHKISDETKDKISSTLKQKHIEENKSFGWKKYWENTTNRTSWNSGLTKESDNRVAKISKSKMGHEVSKEARNKMSKAKKGKKIPQDRLLIQLTKQYITKKLNNSFNTSSTEEKFYKELLEQNKTKTIYRQYKDQDRYPFYCDFYILEDDLFIEVNAHWSHGGKPYNPEDQECQEQLKIWQEKAKTSQFYRNAIEVWTIRDVEKQRIAKQNKLNYKVIY